MTEAVTTVVITRNRREQLLETLARHAAPVIVVDNASEDGTAVAVQQQFPEAQLIRMDHNAGAHGRTIGARLATTELIAFADDDSWWEPGSLERAAEVMDRHPGIGLLVARVIVEPGGRDDPFNAVLASSPLPRDPGAPGIPVLGFMACAAVVRREAFLSVGGFDPVLGIGGEEQLLAWDLASRGWDLRHLYELIVHHEPRPGPGRKQNARIAHMHRTAVVTALLRRPPGAVASSAADAVRGGWPGVLGLAGALRLLAYALRHRQPLPPAVEHSIRILER